MEIALLAGKDKRISNSELASSLWPLFDKPLREVIIKETQLAAIPRTADECAKFLKWLSDNKTYLYFHPVSRQFGLDQAARDHAVNSRDYRVKNPWGDHEGPKNPDVQKPTM